MNRSFKLMAIAGVYFGLLPVCGAEGKGNSKLCYNETVRTALSEIDKGVANLKNLGDPVVKETLDTNVVTIESNVGKLREEFVEIDMPNHIMGDILPGEMSVGNMRVMRERLEEARRLLDEQDRYGTDMCWKRCSPQGGCCSCLYYCFVTPFKYFGGSLSRFCYLVGGIATAAGVVLNSIDVAGNGSSQQLNNWSLGTQITGAVFLAMGAVFAGDSSSLWELLKDKLTWDRKRIDARTASDHEEKKAQAAFDREERKAQNDHARALELKKTNAA